MAWMAAIVAVVAILAGTIVVLALRQAGLRVNAQDADEKRRQVEAQFQSLSREFAEYKRKTMAQVSDLYRDIKSLEADLEKCESPGSKRSRLEQLMSKAKGVGG